MKLGFLVNHSVYFILCSMYVFLCYYIHKIILYMGSKLLMIYVYGLVKEKWRSENLKSISRTSRMRCAQKVLKYSGSYKSSSLLKMSGDFSFNIIFWSVSLMSHIFFFFVLAQMYESNAWQKKKTIQYIIKRRKTSFYVDTTWWIDFFPAF